MNKKQYSFVTKWEIKAPVQDVWQAIYLSEEWPNWWKAVISVQEIKKGNELGIGSIRVYTLSSPMKYKLTFHLQLTERIEMKLLKGIASGDLHGSGIWRFSENGKTTCVTCNWEVATNVRWMNVLALFLAPIFRYNHRVVMKQGAKCLAKKLNAELLSC